MLAMTTYRYTLLIVHVFNRPSTLNDRSAVVLVDHFDSISAASYIIPEYI
jgi:hypothetical protein